MKRIQTKIFSNPFLYHYLRYLFSFGLRTKHVNLLLDPQSNDNILDIGCGIGYYSQFVKNAKYVGVDYNESYIDLATNRYGTEKITFEVKDILNESFNNLLGWGGRAQRTYDFGSGLVHDLWFLPN